MTTISYRPDCSVEDLQVGECTMHRAVNSGGPNYWHMWFRVNRETDGQPFNFCVPMNPHGDYTESGPGGKTWGLRPTGTPDHHSFSTPEGLLYGSWQVSPSINVLADGDCHPGAHPAPSQWHQTPTILDVPPDARWITEAP